MENGRVQLIVWAVEEAREKGYRIVSDSWLFFEYPEYLDGELLTCMCPLACLVDGPAREVSHERAAELRLGARYVSGFVRGYDGHSIVRDACNLDANDPRTWEGYMDGIRVRQLVGVGK